MLSAAHLKSLRRGRKECCLSEACQRERTITHFANKRELEYTCV